MEIGVCWNCQTKEPENVEHPDRDKVIREHEERRPISFTKTGITLVATSAVVLVFSFLYKTIGGYFNHYRWDGIVIGAIGMMAGIVFLVKGASKND
jgi:hypothetical protein